jgi:predicted nucleic-acid-binding Zn-ribbon protein
MNRISLKSDSVATGIDLKLKPKCIACGNTRVFHVTIAGETGLWNTMDPFPALGKLASCGKCRSRNAFIMDYSD